MKRRWVAVMVACGMVLSIASVALARAEYSEQGGYLRVQVYEGDGEPSEVPWHIQLSVALDYTKVHGGESPQDWLWGDLAVYKDGELYCWTDGLDYPGLRLTGNATTARIRWNTQRCGVVDIKLKATELRGDFGVNEWWPDPTANCGNPADGWVWHTVGKGTQWYAGATGTIGDHQVDPYWASISFAKTNKTYCVSD